MAKRKAKAGPPPPVEGCEECKEAGQILYRMAVCITCEKHGTTKFPVKMLMENQIALGVMLNWYIDLAGPDIYLEAQRLAREGNIRAIDIVKLRGEVLAGDTAAA